MNKSINKFLYGMIKDRQKIKNRGYVMLFTTIIVTIISMITIGLSNTAYKQIILSSVAKDSTTAFAQSDIALECALYFENKHELASENFDPPTSWTCSDDTLFVVKSTPGSVITYTLSPSEEESKSNNKCFRITIEKTITITGDTRTTVKAKGYNICNTSNLRTVERAVDINY